MLLLALAACAHPPTQEMAHARSAIQTAKSLPGHNPRADDEIRQAERELQAASQAIREKNFALAREKALNAKHRARRAAKLKQQSEQ